MELTQLNKDRRKNRKPAIDLTTLVYGKIPPQAKDLEEAVLGALMIERSAFDIVSEIIKPEVFYVDANQRIFKAIQQLVLQNMPVDILTVVEQLKKNDELDMVGGPYYVTKLTNAIVSTANIEAHSKIIIQKFISRELIRIGGEIIGEAYEDHTDCFELLDGATVAIDKLTNGIYTNEASDMLTCSSEFSNNLASKMLRSDELSGVNTGYREINNLTHGWQPTDLIILAARPAIGKTAFALNLACKAAANPVKPVAVGFFNMEMSRAQLMERIVSAWSEVPLENIRRGRIDAEQKNHIDKKVIKRLEQLPLFIDDTAALNILEFRSKARRMVHKFHVGLIIIDYLQLMSDVFDGERRNREQQISNITRNLKKIAKELNVPIIALSQLSRAIETRSEKKGEPVLSDLRESGAIEQDSDIVAFIYRPENIVEPGETFIKFAKHRNGVLEKIKLIAKLHIQKFFDPDDEKLKDGKLIAPAGGFVTQNFDEGFKDTKYQF